MNFSQDNWSPKQDLNRILPEYMPQILSLWLVYLRNVCRKNIPVRLARTVIKKGKAIPVTGHEVPQGCELSWLPHFLNNRLTDGGEVVSLTPRPAFLYPSGRFLVLVSVRGWVDPRATVRLEGLGKLKRIQWAHRESNTRPPAFSIMLRYGVPRGCNLMIKQLSIYFYA
jgi:hypothetical protein